jgi:hypothetical protein
MVTTCLVPPNGVVASLVMDVTQRNTKRNERQATTHFSIARSAEMITLIGNKHLMQKIEMYPT